jgi:type II secretory pathway pseudopilin PulG
LIEVMIVLVILAIIAALVVPSFTQGKTKADEATLKENLRNLRRAIQLYTVDHTGRFPTAAGISGQLTQYSDEAGNTSPVKTATHIYGPYLPVVPLLNVGQRSGKSGIAAADGPDVGWIYNPATGSIQANTTDAEVDDKGQKFSEY